MKAKFILSVLFVSALIQLSHAQTQLLFENFETPDTLFALNTGGPASNTGNNVWIVTNNYAGGGIYPNTINEDSTFGGSISYAPYSYYLHIMDVASGYTNCNYSPTNASDRFAYLTNGICTKGYDNVTLSFYYLCQGSATAYGTVYYSADNGPWTQCGAAQYNNKYKWQYTTITNPAFDNVADLRIGFRWQNNAGSGTDTSAFAIDDFGITGTTNVSGINITASVSPDTICVNSNATVNFTFTLSDSLCIGGNYSINLYDSANNLVAGWTTVATAPMVNGPLSLIIPNSVKGTHCYQWRVDRTSNPTITGTASGCFYVENCPYSITTQQPVATMDSTKSVCAGSTVQIPFYSTGTYGSKSIYYAELSDSAGNFNSYDSLYNPLFNNSAYPPSGPAGEITCWIPDTVKAGCNYYVRVLSTSPQDTGTAWGPFCITHCDMNIKTTGGGGGGGNNAGNGSPTSQLACIHSCTKGPGGVYDTLNFDINSYASNVTYGAGNKFEVQLLSTADFSIVNTGTMGMDSASGKMILHIPCADSVCSMNGGMLLYPSSWGGYGGNFYLRIIATNPTPADSNVSPLIWLSIGYPNDKLSLDPSPAHSSDYCLGQTVTFYADPMNNCTWDWYNSNSSYEWRVNNLVVLNGADPGISFNEPEGTYTVMAQEDNNGCYGPVDTTIFFVSGLPSVSITGPATLCIGDTGSYSMPFNNNTNYSWTSSSYSYFDTAANILHISYSTAGSYLITANATDSCGTAKTTKVITVKNCTSGMNALNSSAEDVSVYPNPTPGLFNLSISGETHAQISIQNILGQVIYSANYSTLNGSVTRQIDLSPYGKGVYFLKVISDRGVAVRKVVVQ